MRGKRESIFLLVSSFALSVVVFPVFFACWLMHHKHEQFSLSTDTKKAVTLRLRKREYETMSCDGGREVVVGNERYDISWISCDNSKGIYTIKCTRDNEEEGFLAASNGSWLGKQKQEALSRLVTYLMVVSLTDFSSKDGVPSILYFSGRLTAIPFKFKHDSPVLAIQTPPPRLA